MSSNNGPSPRKIKCKDGAGAVQPVDEEDSVLDPEEDPEVNKALTELDSCQNDIDALNEKASEEILLVEQKYNKLRKPHYESRNAIIKRIPNFWVTVFLNHPEILLTEEEGDVLHYMSKLEVEEFEDIKSGFKIKFHFDENPFFENNVLVKEFYLGMAEEEPYSSNTPIIWKKEYANFTKKAETEIQSKSRKRAYDEDCKSFFNWFAEHIDPTSDHNSEVIKDDIWHNPLQYYLVDHHDYDSDEQGEEEDGDDSSGMDETGDEELEEEEVAQDADDEVVVEEEVEEDAEEEDDDPTAKQEEGG